MTERSSERPRPRGWLRRLGGYLMRHRRDVILSLVAAVLGSSVKVVTPLIARVVVDDVGAGETRSLLAWIALLLVLAVIGFGLAYVRRFRAGRAALEVQNDLRREMHDRLQAMDAATLDTMPTGQLVARANSDTGLVLGLLNFYPLVSGNVLMMVLSLVVMFVLSPLLALVSLAVLPALLVVSYRMRRRVFPASWDGQQREGDLAGIVDEDVAGVRVVKAFGQEGRELQRLADAASDLYGAQMRSTRIQARYQPVLEAIPQLGQVGILALGGIMALNGQLTLGTFLAFSSYIAQLMAPARQLAGILTIAQQARAGVERIFQLLDRKPRIADAPGAVDLPAYGPSVGEIVFHDVRFTYPGQARAVLDGFSLTIRPGERVALVGASGSGKSTVMRLLARYYEPDSGRITVGGVEVRQARLQSLRRAVGLTFEDSFLFSESIRDNIAYGDPDASDAQIMEAARRAQADAFIRALPHGYDTVVGERGLSLSGGQRQRIALARVLLREAPILVLDDATSAIDARTEQAIHDELREAMAERTVLIVAHRHSTLHLADRIIVLDAGRVVDEGTHDALIERSAVYRALFLGEEEDAAGGDVDALIDAAVRPPASVAEERQAAAARHDVSLGTGAGQGGGWRKSLAPTPELLALVDRLEPVKDVPTIDLEQESRRQPHFSLGTLLREFRRPLSLALVFVVIDAVAGLVGPALVKTGVDDGVVTGATSVLLAASGLYLAVVLLGAANGVGEAFVTGRVAQRVMLSLRIRIFAQLQRLSLDYYEREMAGRIMTRMTTDVDQFEQLLENGLLGALVAIVTFVGVAVALVVLDVPLGLATLCVIIPLIIATLFFRTHASRLYNVSRERIAVVNAAFQEGLSGIRESQAFTHEEATIRRFARLSARHVESRVAAQRLVATYFPFVQFLSSVADAIVLGLGAYLIANGQLTTGTLIAFLLYIDMFFSPIGQLSQVFDSWQQTRVSVGRIAGLMRLETVTPDPKNPVAKETFEGEVDFDDVHFAYPSPPVGSAPGPRGPQDSVAPLADSLVRRPAAALDGVNVTVAPGETVALVGETGAGKTTMMKLIARFYDPDSGAVRADGVDLRSLRLASYRHSLGYVPQESFLFTGTIRDNIAYGRPAASDDEVRQAARTVGADRMIRTLPGGYGHIVSERGRSLSAGQRQLIALARAQLVDPAILLLDEATSNLDLATEARVTRAMDRLTRGRTTVLIAHRLQTAMGADRIVMLDHGRIVEVGNHHELVALGGPYAAMWHAFETAAQPAGGRIASDRSPST